jgi:hypothetical protein
MLVYKYFSGPINLNCSARIGSVSNASIDLGFYKLTSLLLSSTLGELIEDVEVTFTSLLVHDTRLLEQICSQKKVKEKMQ